MFVMCKTRRLTLSSFLISELTKNGFHYGHDFVHWNNNIISSNVFLYRGFTTLIFDVFLSSVYIRKSLTFFRLLSTRGASVLFVEDGRPVFDELLIGSVDLKKDGAVFRKWVGGTLTNFHNVVLPTVKKMQEERWVRSRPSKYNKLLINMRFLPNAVFNLSARNSHFSVNESNLLAIPSLGVLDSDCYFNQLTFPIFGNDDSVESVRELVFFAIVSLESGRLRTTLKFFNLANSFVLRYLRKTKVPRLKSSRAFKPKNWFDKKPFYTLSYLMGPRDLFKQLSTEISVNQKQTLH